MSKLDSLRSRHFTPITVIGSWSDAEGADGPTLFLLTKEAGAVAFTVSRLGIDAIRHHLDLCEAAISSEKGATP